MLEKFLGVSTVTYCEPAIHEIIKRPGYAVTNLAYLVMAAFIVLRYPKSRLAKPFALLSLTIGTFSMFYDIYNNYLTQLVDLGGMFAFTGLLLYLNFKEIKQITLKRFLYFFLPVVVLGFGAIYFYGKNSGQIFFGILVITSIVTELYLQYKNKREQKIYWLCSFGLFTVAFGIWLLDFTKTWCDPTNIFNGRGIFHYLTAVVIYLLYLHYSSQKANLKLK